jgi:DNA-binding YbaB/EbfC family protein
MVTVTANGKCEILSVKLDPKALADGDIEMLEDLVLAAVNEAHRRAEEMMKSALSKIAGPLGGGFPSSRGARQHRKAPKCPCRAASSKT